jgi:two-component system chemotaxis sensor kinase CheA
MDSLISGFLEEAHELIGDLEDSLLKLEEQPNDKEAINRVFRVMHTLKGSGGMFGFTLVSDFTHHLENIYYKIRNNEIQLTTEILTLTLKSVDLIKALLKSPEISSLETKNTYKLLVEEIKNASNGTQKTQKSESPQKTKIRTDISPGEGENTFYIHFQPDANILLDGTNPLYLIDELISLGQAIVVANTSEIPTVNTLSPDHCYVSWEILLATNAHIQDISDVFIFVEGESKIEIQLISPCNVLEYPEFINTVDAFRKQKHLFELDKLIALGETVEKQTPPKQEEAPKATGEYNNQKPKSVIQEPSIQKEPIQIEEVQENKPNVFSTIRVSSIKVETLMNLVSEMVTSQARLNLLSDQIKSPELADAIEHLEKLTRQLRDNAFEISLIPIESMVTRFKRLIRDLASELNKEVNFIAEGTETELDKTIIENLNDPLMHIFRNAIDHGIEDAETRKKNGKPAIGTIKLKSFYSGTNVIIQIIDDGKGINPDIIRQKAIEKGLISDEDILSQNAIFDLITQPGFSTASTITDISGRGVGMDVVKKNIQKIQGELIIESKPGRGTTFTLKLPLTLSIIDGLIVSVENTPYIIPILNIDKIRPITHSYLKETFNNTIVLDNEQLPFIYLRERFEIPSTAPAREQVVVVYFENKKMGIVIDKVEKQSQVVVKSIGKRFHHLDIISGASILGNGKVALVLDTNKIISTIGK